MSYGGLNREQNSDATWVFPQTLQIFTEFVVFFTVSNEVWHWPSFVPSECLTNINFLTRILHTFLVSHVRTKHSAVLSLYLSYSHIRIHP